MSSVSICMPAYNAERFVAEAIESVLCQTHRDLELIVINDGSRDRTHEIALGFARKDSRVKLFSNPCNQGLTAARNRAFQEASGSFLAIADADDVLHPERIERQLDFLRSHPGVGVLGTDVAFLEAGGRDIPSQPLYEDDAKIRFQMRFLPCLWNTTTIYRREVLEQVGGYDSAFDAGGEDFDLWSRLLTHTDFANLPLKLVSCRLYGESVSAAPSGRCLDNVLEVSRRLLNEYANLAMSPEERGGLHLFMIRGGVTPEVAARSLEILEQLRQHASACEPARIARQFSQDLASVYLTHSEYLSYRSRRLSGRLLRAAAFCEPRSCLQPRFARQLIRSAVVSRFRG